jgi:hypothetical protein
MRRRFLALGAALLLQVGGSARADSHHQLIDQRPIMQGKKVVGLRGTVLLEPQGYTSQHGTLGGDVRLALGGLSYDRSKADPTNYNHHRDAVAGVTPGYVIHQLRMREITGPNPEDRGPWVETMTTGGQAKEVEFEVLYKDNKQLIPGKKVDLVAGFWKGSYWHVWGAADSPTHSSQDFILSLPGTRTSRQIKDKLSSLHTELAEAHKAETAAQAQLSTAQAAHQQAQAALQPVLATFQAAQAAYQQATQQAYAAHQTAIQPAQATLNAAQQAYNQAYSQAYAVYQKENQDAYTKRQAASTQHPGDQTAYQQATQQALTIYQQASQQARTIYQQATTAPNASTIYQQALNQAHTAYNQALADALAQHKPWEADYQKETAAAQAKYQAALQPAQAELNAAQTAFRQATQGPDQVRQAALTAASQAHSAASAPYYAAQNASSKAQTDVNVAQAAVSTAQAKITTSRDAIAELEKDVLSRKEQAAALRASRKAKRAGAQ